MQSGPSLHPSVPLRDIRPLREIQNDRPPTLPPVLRSEAEPTRYGHEDEDADDGHDDPDYGCFGGRELAGEELGTVKKIRDACGWVRMVLRLMGWSVG